MHVVRRTQINLVRVCVFLLICQHVITQHMFHLVQRTSNIRFQSVSPSLCLHALERIEPQTTVPKDKHTKDTSLDLCEATYLQYSSERLGYLTKPGNPQKYQGENKASEMFICKIEYIEENADDFQCDAYFSLFILGSFLLSFVVFF